MKRIDIVDLNSILENTSDLWKDIEEKTIFITGGTGFFGLWLLESFVFINRNLGLNAKLILLTRNKKSFIEKYPFVKEYSEISYIEGDILDFQYPSGPIDYIIHAATEASAKLNMEQPLAMLDTIIKGTKHVLDLAIKKNVNSFLLTSSGAVYGIQPSILTHVYENYNGAPDTNNFLSAYGEGKRISELMCSIYFEKNKLPIKIARCFAFVGPYLPLDRHYAIGNFIKNVLENVPINISSNGSSIRSYLYASDLTTWLWTILLKGHNNTSYNVGSDQDISIKDLASTVMECGNSKQGLFLKSDEGNLTINRYVPSIDRCKTELSLNITVDLKTSIVKTINFYNKDSPK